MEFLCADPISEPQTEQFISTCLAHPQSNRQDQSLPSLQLQLSKILPKRKHTYDLSSRDPNAYSLVSPFAERT